MTPGSIQGKTEADQVAPYLLRPVYEWTDGELQREITKHKTALDSLADDVPADRKALERHLTEYRKELESRQEARRKPIDASTVLRGVYHSTCLPKNKANPGLGGLNIRCRTGWLSTARYRRTSLHSRSF